MFRTAVTRLGKRFMSNNVFVDKYTSLPPIGKATVYGYGLGAVTYSLKSAYDGSIDGLNKYKNTEIYKNNGLNESERWNYVYNGFWFGFTTSLPSSLVWPAAVASKIVPQMIVSHDDKTTGQASENDG